MVVAAARALKTAVPSTLAVVRPREQRHQSQLHAVLLQEGCELAVCDRAHAGMGASLACGVRASTQADGWIVTLGDMPAIDPNTIRAIVAALGLGHASAAPSFKGTRGHPVGFSARCLPELLRLDGDEGARGVLEAFPPYLVEVNDPGILIDIDQPPSAAN